MQSWEHSLRFSMHALILLDNTSKVVQIPRPIEAFIESGWAEELHYMGILKDLIVP